MFYIKNAINGETIIKIEITDENVFTVCPECGKEFTVDLQSIFDNIKEGSIEKAVYCPECLEIRADIRESIRFELEFVENIINESTLPTAIYRRTAVYDGH